MIVPFLAAASTLAGPAVFEFPDPNATYITVQAIVRLDLLGGRELALAQVVEDTLLDATQDFNQDKLRQFSTLTGQSMKCALSADHFRIQLEVPKGQMSLAGEVMGDLLQHPRFDEDVLKADLESTAFRQTPYWAETLSPYKFDFRHITRDETMAFFQKRFTPESTVISIGGAFNAGEGKLAMGKVLEGWQAPAKSQYEKKVAVLPVSLLRKHSFPITTSELYGAEVSGTGGMFPELLLAGTALGTGKGSAMHRILREKLALSYLQQSAITPTPDGFQLHLILACKPTDNDIALPETMRKALLEDVNNWNEETRKRALGMAQAFLLRESAATPLYFDGASPITASLEDQTFMQGFWQMKVNRAWDPTHLLELLSQVSVDDLKKTALDFLSKAQGGVIRGAS